MLRQGKYTKRVTPAGHIKRQTKRRFRWWRNLSWKQRFLYIGAPLLAILIIIPLATYFYFARDISNQDRLMNRNNTGIVLYDNTGKNVIFSSGRAEHRDLTKLPAIATTAQKALIASEDKDFYEHSGFSVLSTLRAVYGYVISGGKAYGGSTLTQQLAKITLLSSDRSFLRQYQAFSVAVAIENTYSKDQILEMYLNSVYFGENAFGIQDAAKFYFGITPDKLTLAQSSMLVGLLPAPNLYSPISGNPEYAKQQQNNVLSRMVAEGYITEAEKQAALAEVLAYQPAQSPINESAAPHFAEMVLAELYKKYGQETVMRSGYQVTTTLDQNIQNQLKIAIAGNMNTINRNDGHNASAVAIDPSNGEVRGLVGSYSWTDANFGKVNMVTTPRQPGSSFKPIYYSQALADGAITPATILKDVKTDFGNFAPHNADRQFRGNVTVRNALNWSLNIPAVQVMQKVGIDNAVQTAQRMGITIDANKDYGLSLALGTAEVSLLQMTNAYAAFANAGNQYSPAVVKSINSKYNEKVYATTEASKQVISEQGAYLLSNILSDNTSRSRIFGSGLNVYDAKTRAVKKAAVKTGTTDDSRDAWTIGYTPQMAIGVWVGNNDNAKMSYGGSIMAGPIWTKAMGAILAGVQTDFPMAPGIVQRDVCVSNGGLADGTVGGQTYKEYFISTNLPSENCSVKQPVQEQVEQKPKEEESETSNPVETSTSLSVSPSGSAPFGTSVTLTAVISSSSAEGTITFKDGSAILTKVEVNGGYATYTTSSLLPGSHQLSAVFTPSDTTKFEDSTSSTASLTVTTGLGLPNNSGNNGNGRN